MPWLASGRGWGYLHPTENGGCNYLSMSEWQSMLVKWVPCDDFYTCFKFSNRCQRESTLSEPRFRPVHRGLNMLPSFYSSHRGTAYNIVSFRPCEDKTRLYHLYTVYPRYLAVYPPPPPPQKKKKKKISRKTPRRSPIRARYEVSVVSA